MKVYVVFIQTKVYQGIGNVYSNIEEANKNAQLLNNQFTFDLGYLGAVVLVRDLIE